jgi:membrane protein implicated in regulation of membrane protease activity
MRNTFFHASYSRFLRDSMERVSILYDGRAAMLIVTTILLVAITVILAVVLWILVGAWTVVQKVSVLGGVLSVLSFLYFFIYRRYFRENTSPKKSPPSDAPDGSGSSWKNN